MVRRYKVIIIITKVINPFYSYARTTSTKAGSPT